MNMASEGSWRKSSPFQAADAHILDRRRDKRCLRSEVTRRARPLL